MLFNLPIILFGFFKFIILKIILTKIDLLNKIYANLLIHTEKYIEILMTTLNKHETFSTAKDFLIEMRNI